MPVRHTVLLWLCLPAFAGLLAAGCGGGSSDEPAPKEETFERVSRLWPDVPPPPEPSANVSGSLQPGAPVGGASPSAPAAPPAGETPAGESNGETPAAEPPAGEAPTEEPPADEAPATEPPDGDDAGAAMDDAAPPGPDDAAPPDSPDSP